MSKLKKVFKKVAPLAPLIGLVPGLQPLAAAGLGAGLGALSGGGLKGALTGGLGAYGVAGGASQLGSALGATGPTANALGGGLLGAGVGGAQGGVKGALLGGAAGGIGGYAQAGGFDGTAIGDIIGTQAGTPLSGGLQGPTQGSGVLGAVTRNIGSGSLSGNGFSNLAKFSPALNAVGAFNEYSAQDDIEEMLRKQQLRSEGLLNPYTTAKFEPGDLTQDPGYQFRLQEGQQALDRSLAASGSMQSGRALKAAQEYGQGLADQTYNDAYRRWLQGQNFNFDAARTMTGVYDNLGNIGAGAEVGRVNAVNRGLSALSGAGTRTIIGYDENNKPVYSKV